MLAAAVLLALVPFIADPFLRLSVRALGALSVGGFLGSLAAVLVLVAVPVMLLGAVAPYANRLSLARVADTGRVTGGLYAISTAGSLLGTFASALLLIPLIGTTLEKWFAENIFSEPNAVVTAISNNLAAVFT